MEEQTTTNNWLSEEVKALKNTAFDETRAPALKLEENKITELVVDFSKPFDVWADEENNTLKKIVPVKVNGNDFVWWLNVKNPIYHQLVELGLTGKNTFKVLQTGSKQNTRYTLVE